MRKKKSKHIGFDALEHKVARQYEKKGDSKKTALRIGKDVAGKVYWSKKRGK
ncbi:hypothetical protein LLE49_20050 [Alicyclobacillus tolerans]|uniref:hypothetical protein n=1 Tax=Alicyclobacillus tolerans TaxID=90970 RepID=UPI001F1DCF22|nr:hypothetical protein [Alicyclobacillus tolerans]MCF8567017.1 hypothetical protein [Alicyclobacillus tolerans]